MKIIDLIKYEGDNSTFIWKYPGEDFNTLSQLIVHESQEALFFKTARHWICLAREGIPSIQTFHYSVKL